MENPVHGLSRRARTCERCAHGTGSPVIPGKQFLRSAHEIVENLRRRVAACERSIGTSLQPTPPGAGRAPIRPDRLGWAALLLLPLALAGCSATSSIQHDPAQFAPIDSAAEVGAGTDVVWDGLKNRPPPPGFTVVEVDNAQRLLRLSLTTDQPEAYVDCGRTRRTFEGAFGKVETFDYQPAARATYKLSSYKGVPLEAARDTVLDATAVVQTTPSGPTTRISVNVSYVLKTMITYSKLGLFGSPTGELDAVTREIRFQTDKPGIGDEEVAFCLSNGKLERQLLGWAA
jgi:hypothetical protein